jgi:hypothetical protein
MADSEKYTRACCSSESVAAFDSESLRPNEIITFQVPITPCGLVDLVGRTHAISAWKKGGSSTSSGDHVVVPVDPGGVLHSGWQLSGTVWAIRRA